MSEWIGSNKTAYLSSRLQSLDVERLDSRGLNAATHSVEEVRFHATRFNALSHRLSMISLQLTSVFSASLSCSMS